MSSNNTGNIPLKIEPKSPVDRNYELLLRIARQVGVILTPEEENDSLGF